VVSPPAVTVVIATYNWSNVLPYSIGSVLDQTFTDFELLVIGDGCTDDSADVVASVDDPRVQWHNLDVRAGHQSSPNNEGIRTARGSVIAYLGHDDLWLPHHLETLVAALQRGATMAYGRTLSVVPDETPTVGPSGRWVYQPGTWIPPTAMAHDRDLVMRAGGWRQPSKTGALDPEAELWHRMSELGGPPRLVPKLTNVKFPAYKRRDVYKSRPSEEQAWWLERIRRADDSEQALLAIGKPEAPATLMHAVRGRLRLRTRLGLGRPQSTVSAEERAREHRG
jgi:glycosyltransferase involved in cell wall biosynthesis